jgi:hypothetical protein
MIAARRPASLLVLMLALTPAAHGRVHGQGVRINGSSAVRYIEVRPLQLATDPATTTEPLALVPFTQDLHLNAWGLGQGVRLYAHVRVRASLSGPDDLWPQADDAFDALSAFVEVDRSYGRVRIGRQWSSSRLGFYNFDGAALLARPWSWLSTELYGGWALAPGLNESVTGSALAAVEELAPGRRSNLIGVQVGARRAALRLGGEYQREIRTDRAGLYGERAAADASLELHDWRVGSAIEADLAGRRVNEGYVRLQPPALLGFQPLLQLRTHRPYFPLWTIWGAFSPVGFDEAGASLGWSGRENKLTFDLRGAYRTYHDDDAVQELFGGLRTNGWRAGVAASWQATQALSAFSHYQADIGFGAARSEGGAGVRFEIKENSHLVASLIAFQTAHELQVRDGTVVGAATSASVRLRPDAQLSWDFAVYRHLRARGIQAVDWNQFRASAQLDWSIGSDPGMRAAQRQR